jgi:hypothetical protein
MSQSLSLAQEVGWNLATTLMVCGTLFKTDLSFGVLPTARSAIADSPWSTGAHSIVQSAAKTPYRR